MLDKTQVRKRCKNFYLSAFKYVYSSFSQYGIVSSSCDDRQPGVAWRYADVFENLGWINSIIKPAVNQHQYGTSIAYALPSLYPLVVS